MWQFEHSIVSNKVSKQQLWTVLTDVENWHQWDHQIEWSHSDGSFANGMHIHLKPKNGPAVKGVITEYKVLESFTDKAKLALATYLEFSHFIEEIGKDVKMTHRIRIYGPLTFLFKRIIGKKIQQHLPTAMENLLKIATSK